MTDFDTAQRFARNVSLLRYNNLKQYINGAIDFMIEEIIFSGLLGHTMKCFYLGLLIASTRDVEQNSTCLLYFSCALGNTE